eukprot:CAMPEP_0172503552 /NCGR_PEP_ID=MMETSP1066-20121228/170362_1 /TAXON_ID=671091 /ORGANISM="Coscinodiscus wailesii, Strain CCMP2513" /LENGTH=874 /DNA_ID=CAMNT_0013279345 /DNA_START=92 /DNA_END=2716 /DNA_ORIENTATION=-
MPPSSENVSANTTTTSSQQQPLTKSQKKRMKQKAAKAKKEAERAQQLANATLASAASSPAETLEDAKNTANVVSLNPHMKLRHDLQLRGYGSDEIEHALEEMWDLGLEYDSFDAALVYLEGKKAQREAELAAAADAAAAAEVIESVGVVKVDVVAVESVEEDVSDAGVVVRVESVEEEGGDVVDEAMEEVGGDADVEESVDPPPPVDLASKLNVVAQFENLHDGVFALSEWVTKAAKPHEMLELCTIPANSSLPPLYTLIRRCILECPKDADYATLRSSLKGLIAGILAPLPNIDVGSSNGDANAVKKTINESLLKSVSLARGAITECHKSFSSDSHSKDSIANSIGEFVVSTISVALSTCVNSNDSPTKAQPPQPVEEIGLASIKKIEDEITSILSQLPTRGNGVVELMTRRDCQKVAADKSFLLTKLLINAATTVTANGSHTSVDENNNTTARARLSSDEGRQEMATCLLAEHMPIVQESRAAFEMTQRRLKDAESEQSALQASLTADLLACQKERVRVENRKDELRKQMEELDRESDNIMAKEFEISSKLDKLSSDSNEEVSSLASKREELMGAVRVDDIVNRVLDELHQFESGLTAMQTAVINAKAEAAGLASKEKSCEITKYVDYETKISSFFVQMRSYFVAEADIIDFLRVRVSSLQVDMKGLQREVAECTALGMATNVSQMTQSLDEISRNITEDEAAIAALCDEAENMRDELIKKTKEYAALGRDIKASDRSILTEIGTLLTRIGVGCDNQVILLPPTILTSDTNSTIPNGLPPPAITPPDIQQSAQHNVLSQPSMSAPSQPPYTGMPEAPIPQPAVVAAPPAPAVKLPKLSWAIPNKAATKKVGVKSLLDIQKEEQAAKMGGGSQ